LGVSTDQMVARPCKLVRYKGGYLWRSVKRERYKQVPINKKSAHKESPQDWALIVRNVLIGQEGDTGSMHLRYFEISKGGYSSLEYHNHEHIVIGVRGKGTVRLANRKITLRPFDALYIAPRTIHQLSNRYDEPFGFFCIVKAKRDKPKIVSPTDIT